MRIITHDDGRCLTLRLLGELDHAAAPEATPCLEDAVEEYLPRRCVLDLSGLSFMDSSGIGMLLGRYKTIRFVGGTMAAINVKERMRRVLLLSGVYKVIDIYEGLPQPSKLL